VERPTGRTTLAPSGEAGSPCGARRGDPRRHLRGGPGFGAEPRGLQSPWNPLRLAARSGRCRPKVASRPRPGGAARLRAALISVQNNSAARPREPSREGPTKRQGSAPLHPATARPRSPGDAGPVADTGRQQAQAGRLRSCDRAGHCPSAAPYLSSTSHLSPAAVPPHPACCR